MSLDRADAEVLYRTYGPQVLRRARALLGGEAQAEDAMHEVFVRVIRSGDRRPGEAGFSSWLHTITTNYCLNQLRDRRRRAAKLEAQADRTESEDPRAESLALLRQILSQADDREARAAIHVWVDQMTYDEAAAELSVSRRTLANLLTRFQSRARALFAAAG